MAKIRMNEVSGIALLLFVISIVIGLAISQAIHHQAPAIIGALVGVYFLFAIKVVRQWEKVAVLRLGRYVGLRGPGLFNLDGSVFRNFRMTERFNLQFRAECFGATNTPQFNNPGATVSSLTRNADGTIRALNGYTEITGAGGERNFRFALKLTF